jgi:hypothetical protein
MLAQLSSKPIPYNAASTSSRPPPASCHHHMHRRLLGHSIKPRPVDQRRPRIRIPRSVCRDEAQCHRQGHVVGLRLVDFLRLFLQDQLCPHEHHHCNGRLVGLQ